MVRSGLLSPLSLYPLLNETGGIVIAPKVGHLPRRGDSFGNEIVFISASYQMPQGHSAATTAAPAGQSVHRWKAVGGDCLAAADRQDAI
jgi:hypothetical protein